MHSAGPPPCQRLLQPGWTEVVLSDGIVFLFKFLCVLALEIVRSFGAHLYYIQKLFWKTARGFTACTGGNSAGISASTAWIDALWLGIANILSSCFHRIFCDFRCFLSRYAPPGSSWERKWSSVASGWPKAQSLLILASFQASIWKPLGCPLGTFLTHCTLQCQFVDVFTAAFSDIPFVSIFSWFLGTHLERFLSIFGRKRLNCSFLCPGRLF